MRPTANAVTAWVGIDDARPAVDQASENYRLVQLRLREGAATPTEIADAQASLTRAQQNYLNARYNYLIAMDRLEYAMGVGRTPMTRLPNILSRRRTPKHAEQPMSATNRPRLLRAARPTPQPRPRRVIARRSPKSVPSGPPPRAGRGCCARRRRLCRS